jgi:hypothetical protein
MSGDISIRAWQIAEHPHQRDSHVPHRGELETNARVPPTEFEANRAPGGIHTDDDDEMKAPSR